MYQFAVYEYPFGYLKIGHEGEKVVCLEKKDEVTDFGRKNEFTDKVFKQILEYLDGKRKEFSFECELRGTEFQVKVWKELAKIPYGETRSYKDVAIAVGNKNAARAVGLANNKNPIGIVYPCHRVIGSNGKLVGYAGGLEIKEYLLKMEKENMNNFKE